jgi:hypothetical protein
MVTSAGNATTVVTNADLTGEVTSIGNLTTVPNATVINKVLTGYTSAAGAVSTSDNILQAIQKLDGNNETNANLTGMVTSAGNATTVITNANLNGPIASAGNTTSITSQTGTGTMFVMANTPTLITPNLGVAKATTPPTSDNSTKVATTAFVNTAITNGASATVTSIDENINSTSNDNTNAATNGSEYIEAANIASGSRTFNKNNNTNTFNAGIDISATSTITITLTQPAFVTSGSSTLNIQPVLTGIDFTNNTFTITAYAFGTILAPNVDFTFNFVIIK